MKTIQRLNIEDKSSYYFTDMTNSNNFDPKLILINEFKIFENGSTMFDISYSKESNTPYVVCNDVECIFRKSGINKYLNFCETEKSKKMLNKYVKIIDEIKDQVLFIIDDKNEDRKFIMGKDFTRFKFKTNDNLPYNQKINVPVCVISLSSVFEERNWYNPQANLQECFFEKNDYFVKN